MNTRYLLVAVMLCTAPSCKPDDGPGPGPDPLRGGKGGTASLRVTPQHHARAIDSCTVYIKYAASDLPTAFDDSAQVRPDAGEQVAVFSGLLKGSYYLYGKGWDTLISDQVIGGLPFTIAEEKVHAVNLPVTEGD